MLPGHLVGKPEHFHGRQGPQQVQDLLYWAHCMIDAMGTGMRRCGI